MKPYFDPEDRPIEAPQEDPPMANEPYLRDDDLPADSFPSPEYHAPATFPSCSHPTAAAATKVPTSTADNGNKIYDAERIVRRRVHRGKPEYLIKWRVYAKRSNTWEPPDHILDERLWDDYYHRYPEHRPLPTLGEEH